MTEENNSTDVVGLECVNIRKGFFFQLHELEMEIRRFDGSLMKIKREVLHRPPAVGVLIYDPNRDEVLLIKQFLIGAHRAGTPNRPLQVVAGMVEEGESSEEVARREAMEEANCEIGRMHLARRFQPSPGGCDELLDIWMAEGDLSNAGGNYGLVEEGEDTKVVILPAEEAISRLDNGEILAGPAVVALDWFARFHPSLRAEWLNTPAPKG